MKVKLWLIKTTTAMDEINTGKFSKWSYWVIDNIAFQTNILSVNAAVEAATAGRSWKKDFVVAQEVRNLATKKCRSSTWDKSNSRKSNSKTNEGKEIATNMIEGYIKNLNSNISSTMNLISDIENASKEQLLELNR